jgi:hypothetical protein
MHRSTRVSLTALAFSMFLDGALIFFQHSRQALNPQANR